MMSAISIVLASSFVCLFVSLRSWPLGSWLGSETLSGAFN